MEFTTTILKQQDGYETKLFSFQTSKDEVLGNVLILHGMTEHHNRYLPFIEYLNAQGFDAHIYNHRGHGQDKALEDLGFFADKGGAELVINDAIHACKHVKENGRSKKLAVFGHSMGSIILRNVIQRYDKMDCVIVCATAMPPVAVSAAGIGVANLVCLFKGTRTPSPLLNNVLFGGKEYTAGCTRTEFDWLTRDPEIVDKYIADPYCGFLCTTSFYRDLVTLTKWGAEKKRIDRTRKDLPVLFLAGDKDPVGGCAKQVQQLHHIFTDCKFADASIIVYPGARHELLNETNKEEVMQDAAAFFTKRLA